MMEKEIQELVDKIGSGEYDPEQTHADYDRCLEEFILNYDANLLPLMKKLIKLEKEFWYA